LQLPKKPGVYLFKDLQGKVIYVGKAKDLRRRVSSYFSKQQQLLKTFKLVEHINLLDVVIVDHEVEALLLERSLIRYHQPFYNVLLRDDKNYPYLCMTVGEEWPTIKKIRKRQIGRYEYFGPYGDGEQLQMILSIIFKIFPLVRCGKYQFKHAKRVCHYHSMKQCLGPCILKVNKQHYSHMLDHVRDFLKGKTTQVRKSLEIKMKQSAEKENYETAAFYRDQLKSLEKVAVKQRVICRHVEFADFFAFELSCETLYCARMRIQNYAVVAHDFFQLQAKIEDEQHAIEQFLTQYYEFQEIPREVYLNIPIKPTLKKSLELLYHNVSSKTKRSSLQIIQPKIGEKKALMNLAMKNLLFQKNQKVELSKRYQVQIQQLQENFSLTHLPRRIGCLDISNLGDQAIVGAIVVFVDGKPAKHLYRKYILHSSKQDDFYSIYEVVQRRCRAIIDEGKEELALDLLIIDGGKGQLHAARKAMEKPYDQLFELISLAKSRIHQQSKTTVGRSKERVFLEHRKQAISLVPGGFPYRLLTQLRDEAHNYVIRFHRRRREQIFFHSSVLEIPGIGPVIYKRLIAKFSGFQNLARASIEALMDVQGVNRKIAQQIIQACQ